MFPQSYTKKRVQYAQKPGGKMCNPTKNFGRAFYTAKLRTEFGISVDTVRRICYFIRV